MKSQVPSASKLPHGIVPRNCSRNFWFFLSNFYLVPVRPDYLLLRTIFFVACSRNQSLRNLLLRNQLLRNQLLRLWLLGIRYFLFVVWATRKKNIWKNDGFIQLISVFMTAWFENPNVGCVTLDDTFVTLNTLFCHFIFRQVTKTVTCCRNRISKSKKIKNHKMFSNFF